MMPDAPSSIPLTAYVGALRERLQSGALLACILDPVQWGNLERDLIGVSSQWTLLYRGSQVREYYAVMPYAVFLREADDFWPEFERRLGQECCIVAEIADAAAFNAARFIRQLMALPHCVTPDGENGFLRYYDPPILTAFLKCADVEQLARLFGDYIAAFWHEDAFHNTVFRSPRPKNLPPPSSVPLRLFPSQLEKLLEAQHETYAQAVARDIRREFFPAEPDVSPQLYAHVRAALDTAERYAFESRTDGWQFVRAAARHGWNFHEQPCFQAILRNAGLSRQEKLTLLTASGEPT